jgi:hypothetical protein
VSKERQQVSLPEHNPIEPEPRIVPPQDTAGRILWSVLQQTPDTLTAYLEQEARALQDRGFDFSRKSFQENGLLSLQYGIQKFYPGGMSALRENLGNAVRVPSGYWGSEEGINRMRAIAVASFERYGILTQRSLRESGFSDVEAAIIQTYPGGWYGLLQDIGMPVPEKPKGYWNEERVLEEAQNFYLEREELSAKALKASGRNDLLSAMKKHGGLSKIRELLGVETIRKAHGFWSIDSIEKEVQVFIAMYGSLSRTLLQQNGRGDLDQAIRQKYPGKIEALCNKFGVEQLRKQNGYWTPETITEEARNVYIQSGTLSRQAVQEHGTSGLAQAITAKYPGGFAALREKLGITDKTQGEKISPQDANNELLQFLEGEE